MITSADSPVFGAVPFNDAMRAPYVNDCSRSRVAGLLLTIAGSVAAVRCF